MQQKKEDSHNNIEETSSIHLYITGYFTRKKTFSCNIWSNQTIQNILIIMYFLFMKWHGRGARSVGTAGDGDSDDSFEPAASVLTGSLETFSNFI